MRRRARLASWCVATVAFTLAVACAKRGPRDVGNRAPPSELGADAGAAAARDVDGGPPRVVATPAAKGLKPRPLVRVDARALATDATHVYFGDSTADTLCALEKNPPEGARAEPTRIARPAPIAGALSVDSHDAALVWIASPGDLVLRVPIGGGAPTTLRDRAIFTSVTAAGGDVFFTEARGSGGVLTRVTGTTAAQLATFEGAPRGLAVDTDDVYIATSSGLVEAPRARGAVSELASGRAFASPQVDSAWVYATAVDPTSRSRALVRVKKTGGPLETVATGVRAAPIAIHRGIVYWFDAARPALLASSPVDDRPAARTARRVVSDDPTFERVNALTVDDDGAFVATGSGEDARIVVVSIR